MTIWNPWHGCHKISPGCKNCYVYRRDSSFGKDSNVVTKTASFCLPLEKHRDGSYKVTANEGLVYCCMTSDFFIEEADPWRAEIWAMIRWRRDLHFVIITKRIHRFMDCIPEDWGEGYDNVTICATCEDQERANFRLPILLEAPIKHRQVIHEPMLGEIHIEKALSSGKIEQVTCGGESGSEARPCDYEWVKKSMMQCVRCGVIFYFKQTGALFVKDGKTYHIPREKQMEQADKAGINFRPEQEDIYSRLERSEFRRRFHLTAKDKEYVREKGMEKIESHARDFVRNKLAPAEPKNDGKQTPTKGHPVFRGQHACACCCRGCLAKWHKIPKGRPLTEQEQDYVVGVLMEWIRREMQR